MSTSRPNGYTSYRGISRETRPSSAELIDLHVYIVPPEIWRERYNNLLNQNVTETISAGIIRVHPERFVYDLRNELEQQVGEDMLPRDYVFLKSVGRSITRLKQKQEYQLKAKHFIPPQAYAPELYLLEISPDDQGSSRTSTRPHSPFSQNHESEDERRSGNKSKHRHNDSSPYRYSPLPKIKSGHSPTHNRGEYNHNGDIRTENGRRLSDSWGSNRDKRTPPPPQNVPRTPQHPKASRDQTPREHTSRGESHRAPPPRSSPTPTDHRKRADQSREPVSGTYTNHTNEDSGINVNSPEEHFDALDRRKHDEDRNNDLNRRLHPDNEDDHHRNGDISDDEWERRRREEEERRRRESEERRMKEDEDRRKEEEERRRLEEERERISKQQLTGSDEDLNRFPSPPPLQMDSNQGQETESSKQNKKAEKERLMKELEAAREARRAVEKQREELVKKAKLMQTKTQNRRNHDMMNVFDARDLWKKRYFEEKKKTPPLEEQCNRLRHELDIIHRKLMNTLEGPSKEKSTRLGDLKPSQKVGDQQVPGHFYPANYRNAGPAPPAYDQNYEEGLIKQGYQRAVPSDGTENFNSYQPYYYSNNYYNGHALPPKMGSPKLPPISPQSKKSSRPSSYYSQPNIQSPVSAVYRPNSYQPPGSKYSPPKSTSPNARGQFRSPASSGKSVRFEPLINPKGYMYY